MRIEDFEVERKYTDLELKNKGQELAKMLEQVDELEEAKKSYVKNMANEIEQIRKDIADIRKQINKGFYTENRDVDLINDYEAGVSKWIDAETGEVYKQQSIGSGLFSKEQPEQGSEESSEDYEEAEYEETENDFFDKLDDSPEILRLNPAEGVA